MIRFAFAQVIAHKVRLALTVVAVMLGVAFVAGSLVLSDTARQLFDNQFRTASSGADLSIRTATAFDSGMGVEVERDPLPAGTVQDVAALDGVEDAIPVAKGAARLEKDGADYGSVLLTSWVEQPVGAYPLLDGVAPTTSGEIALDSAAAERLDLAVGDTLTIAGAKPAAARIVGLVGFGSEAGPPVGTVVIAGLPFAQAVLGLGDGISEVLVTSATPVAELRPVLADALGSGVQVATAQDLAAAGAEAAGANLQMLQFVLIAMSIAALIIGSFLIANTFGIVVSQRTRELAVVRAAGASGRQVLGSVLAEALIVGAVASAAGVGLGILSAFGLRNLARAFGVSIPDGDLVVEPRTVLLALAIGVVVTLVAAIAPARRAAAVSPVLAMRATAAEARRFGVGRIVTAAVLLMLGVAASTAPAFGANLILLAFGLVLALAGVILIAPIVIRPLIRPVGAVFARTVTGRLARDAAGRAPRRTSSTVMALAVGLALLSFATIVGESVKVATGEQYREVITADAVIESAGQEMLGGVHSAVFDEVRAVDEVAEVTRLKYGHWRDGRMINALTAVDPHAIEDVASIRMVQGRLTDLASGGVVISERVAKDRRLKVGDDLPMTFARTFEQTVPIVGVIASAGAQALQTDFVVSLDTYAKNYTEDMDASIFVRAADGVTSAELSRSLESALVDHPTVQVRDQAAVIAGRTQTVGQIFGLVAVLLAFALVIAVLGVANTLALSIIERRREIGLLRAVGMSRGRVRLMVQLEAVIVSLLAVVIGLVLGGAASFAAVGALGSVAPIGVVFPVVQLVVVAVVVALAGLLAGIAPSRRAAKLPVLAVIADA